MLEDDLFPRDFIYCLEAPITATAREVITETKDDGIYIKEIRDLQVAAQIPKKIPSDKQSAILVNILKKAASEGIK